jgi:hypothetical protein
MSTGYERVCNYSIQVKRHNDKCMNIDYINVSVWIYVYILIYKNTWDMHICTSSNVNTYENTHTYTYTTHQHTCPHIDVDVDWGDCDNLDVDDNVDVDSEMVRR